MHENNYFNKKHEYTNSGTKQYLNVTIELNEIKYFVQFFNSVMFTQYRIHLVTVRFNHIIHLINAQLLWNDHVHSFYLLNT